MKIQIKSNHSGEKRFEDGFKRIIKKYQATKSYQELEESNCQKIILNFITGKITFIYPDYRKTESGLIKEK